MKVEKRYCGRFDMDAEEFQRYKNFKFNRLFFYVILMILVSIFNDRIVGWIYLTIILLAWGYHDGKCEQQWIKDGAITKEDLK